MHRAGRVGRVGQRARGKVISVLQPSEVSELLALGRTLRFRPSERPPPAQQPLSEDMDYEAQVQALSDVFNLYDAGEDADQ